MGIFILGFYFRFIFYFRLRLKRAMLRMPPNQKWKFPVKEKFSKKFSLPKKNSIIFQPINTHSWISNNYANQKTKTLSTNSWSTVIPISSRNSKLSINKYSYFPKTNVTIINKLGYEKILQVITTSAFFDKLTLKQLEIIKQGIPDIEKLNVDNYLF